MNEEQQLDQALRDLGASMRLEQAPARLEKKLLKTYQHRYGYKRIWPVWALACAATVFLGALLVNAPAPKANQKPVPVTASTEPVTTAPEVVTDFFPVRNGPVFEDEVSQLIRVRVPRATLTRYGLPGGHDGPESTVRADVLLGRDGMARAIRFVR